MSHRRKLSKRLFGLKTKEIDKYIDEMRWAQREQLSSLVDRIDRLVDIRDKLKKGLNIQQTEKPEYSEALIKFSIKLIDRLDLYLKQFVRDECSNIERTSDEEINEYKKELEAIYDRITQSKSSLSHLIQDVMKIINKDNYSVEEESEVIAERGKAFSTKAMDSKQIRTEHAERLFKKITADGLVNHDYKSNGRITGRSHNAGKVKTEKPLYLLKKKDRAFWDVSIQEYIETPDENDELPADVETDSGSVREMTEEAVDTINTDCELPEDKVAESAGSYEAKPRENKKDDNNQEKFSSSALDNEIDQLKLKYIVGKVAGKDLTDSEGGTIIKAGKSITPDVIASAERNGKLPELIVNMKIPGLGD